MTINLIFCLLAVAALAMCIVIFGMAYRRLKFLYDDLRISYYNLEKLNSTLRSQRHDYLNHLQVVYGLMELEEYEELKKYLQPVYKDMQKTGKALKTSKPAINALLKAKMDEAEKKGIDFYVEVKSDLKNLKVEDWELCKVISNILDNAMTALSGKEEQGRIVMDITEERERYRFSIANNGPMIPAQMQAVIFKQGITSKKEEGHGMGLYIVSQVVKTYQGVITLESTDTETVFTILFPKKEGERVWKDG